MKRENHLYVVARHKFGAANVVTLGYSAATNRQTAWCNFMRYFQRSGRTKDEWKKAGYRCYRVKVTAEVVG